MHSSLPSRRRIPANARVGLDSWPEFTDGPEAVTRLRCSVVEGVAVFQEEPGSQRMMARRCHPSDILRFTHTLFNPCQGLRSLLAMALFHARCLHRPKERRETQPSSGLIRSVALAKPKTQSLEFMVYQAAKEQSRSWLTLCSKPSAPHRGEDNEPRQRVRSQSEAKHWKWIAGLAREPHMPASMQLPVLHRTPSALAPRSPFRIYGRYLTDITMGRLPREPPVRTIDR